MAPDDIPHILDGVVTRQFLGGSIPALAKNGSIAWLTHIDTLNAHELEFARTISQANHLSLDCNNGEVLFAF
jgi:hypothetical protein